VIKQVWLLSIAGLLLFASVGFAQYTMDLNGIGTGVTADGVYVSPYQGSIWNGAYAGNGTSNAPSGPANVYSGYVICDDFTDESYLNNYWNASATNAANVNSTDLFYGTSGNGPDKNFSAGYSAQQDYNAVAWLANELLMPANLNNSASQTDISFAIWDIMDGATTDPLGQGGVSTWVTWAYNAVKGGYQGTDVTVYTPAPNKGVGNNVSQEFLVVSAPEASAPLLLVVDLVGFLALVAFLRKRALRGV
jgi:hypothetical protein